jgi:hypothetical protein
MNLKDIVTSIFKEEHETGMKGMIDRALNRLKEAGVRVKFEAVDPDISRYDYQRVWESEIAQKYNKEAHVLNHQFFTLYWREEGAGQGWGCGGFYPIPEMFFIFGRVGNTRCISFSIEESPK